MSGTPGRLDIGIIGMGTVGPVLGAALRGVGHRIVAVATSCDQGRERAEAFLPGTPIMDVPDLIDTADLVLLAVPDAEIAPLVSGLAGLDAWRTGQIVVHFAGGHGIGVLAPAQAAGAIPLAIHPVMNFSGMSLDIARLNGTPFAVTAPAPFLPIAQALVVEMGGEPVVIDEDARPLYDAALMLGTNAVTAAALRAVRVGAQAGLNEPAAHLRQLLSATLDRALSEAERAIGAPVTTADTETVTAHVRALAGLSDEAEALSVYETSIRALADAALARGTISERARTSLETALLDRGTDIV